MNYSVSDEVPQAWDHIVSAFVTTVTHDIEFNGGVPIDDIHFSVRHGLLYIAYYGGDRITDAFAAFAKQMSYQTCSGCGIPATRIVFESPKCDDCY
jgi:hypothetical protein